MRRSWTAWRNAEATGSRSSFGRRRSMIWAALLLRVAERLQRDVQKAGVRRAIAAGEGDNVGDGRGRRVMTAPI